MGYHRHAAGTALVERFQQPGGPAFDFEREDLGDHLAWKVGGMVNRGSRAAVGGTLHLGVGGRGGRIALKDRHRHWLDAEGTSVDAAAGVIGAEVNVRAPASRAGPGLRPTCRSTRGTSAP